MSFELMNEADLDEATRIEKENFVEAWPRSSFEYDLNNEVAEIVTLKEHNNLIGYFVTYYMFENADVGKIVVDKIYQGQGYGQKLFKELIRRCIEKNVEFLHLEVRVDNFKAINLYKSFGFEEMRIRKGYYHGVDAIDMVKGLVGLNAQDFSD